MSKKDMPDFNSQILDSNESDINNEGNKNWWQSNPMTYDWDKSLGEPIYNQEYFHQIDDIFGEGHSLVNNPRWPEGYILENFIEYELFNKKEVLEIGCGAGLVSSHIERAGANIHSIDLTEEAIRMTKERFKLNQQQGDIRQMDAENLEFDDCSMDFVVSWGVIHHSSNMTAILDEIYRVLKPNGKAYIMIYHKNSLRYNVYVRFWLGIMKLKYINNTTEEIAGSITDGFIARHLTEKEFNEVSSKFSKVAITFSDEKTTILKYLFGIGKIFAPFYFITKPIQKLLAKNWGWYLEAKITK